MTTTLNDTLTRRVIGHAIEVHRHLGPGLIELVYETCLCAELADAGVSFERQKSVPIVYKGATLNRDFRIDLVIENMLVLEIKSVQQVHSIHEAQLQTYLHLSGLPVGLLMNFNSVRLKDGIKRILGPDAASHYVR